MPRMASLLLLGLAATVALPVTSTAQAQTSPRTEVGASYSFVRFVEGDGLNVPVGWLASVARSANDWLSVVGEVAGNYKFYEDGDTLWFHTFQGGVQVSSRTNPKFRLFGQFLLGGTHLRFYEGFDNVDTETHFSIEPGGGVDVPIRGRMSARIAVGFPMFFAEDETANAFRLQIGVVFGVGNR